MNKLILIQAIKTLESYNENIIKKIALNRKNHNLTNNLKQQLNHNKSLILDYKFRLTQPS